jgi:hypothetical protein
LHHCRISPAIKHGYPPQFVRRGLPTTKKQKMKMIMNDKQDCIESIARVWNEHPLGEKLFPSISRDDPRNMRAAKTLDQLATDVTNLTDQQWLELKPHFSWASEAWRNGLSQAARQVGFHHRATDFGKTSTASSKPKSRAIPSPPC